MTDGRLITGNLDSDIKSWDSVTGQCIDEINYGIPAKRMQGHYNTISRIEQIGKHIITDSVDNTINIWNINNRQQECIYSDTYEWSTTFLVLPPINKNVLIAIATADDTIKILEWDYVFKNKFVNCTNN